MDFAGASTSEATTLQIEFRHLTILTGDIKYWRAAENVMTRIMKNNPPGFEGLVPIYINTNTGEFDGNNIRLGSRADSYYEYLSKQYMQTARVEQPYGDMFEQAMTSVIKNLRAESVPHKYVLVGELPNGPDNRLDPKMDHLVCFLPGTIAQHVSKGRRLTKAMFEQLSPARQEMMSLAVELTETCYHMYKDMASGIAPEIAHFNIDVNQTNSPDIFVDSGSHHNLLRPETVESLYYMYKITGETTYQDKAWEIFEAFEKHTKVPDGGYATLRDVTVAKPEQTDKMESFFMSETLKYLYLIFLNADPLPLTKYIFNTEAHPLPIVYLSEDLKAKLQAADLGKW
jgi:mannosyl-oligosaccharide alpha-1,2-mannosidase